jgi:hypothetical protein
MKKRFCATKIFSRPEPVERRIHRTIGSESATRIVLTGEIPVMSQVKFMFPQNKRGRFPLLSQSAHSRALTDQLEARGGDW